MRPWRLMEVARLPFSSAISRGHLNLSYLKIATAFLLLCYRLRYPASSKSSRSESAHPVSDTGAIKRQDTVDGSTAARKQSQFSNNSGLGGRAKSPTKRVASRPPSASTASSSVAPSPAPVQGEAANKQSAASQNQQQQPPKRQRPTTLNTTSSSTTSPTPQQRKNQPQQQQSQLSQQNSNSSKVRSTKRIEALKVDSRDFPAPKPQPRKYKKPETGNRR
jgi:hypothetical protein